jgi:serine/threonine-protein kinase
MKPNDPSQDPPTEEPRDAPDTVVNPALRPSRPPPLPSLMKEVEPTVTLSYYAFGPVIGKGGAGEVVLAHDRRVGRDVAIKRLKNSKPAEEEVRRFLREAKIQARLDHPAIVPVHELGRDASGRPYFTMKRLAGRTLLQLLAEPKAGQTPRLLRAFSEICLAIEFAHSRGVVHRDVKPANVMLGDFGEVYVLDWGIARVVADAESAVVTADIDTIDGNTMSGDLRGTPGYMAPEQVHSANEVDRPADVYALGSMLFEILADEPLHPRGQQAAIASTLSGDTLVSPLRRRPGRAIAPELDALCTSMLSIDPTARPTAKQVADGIQAYLDGDRDLVRRRAMAIDNVWKARAAYTAGQRAEAIRCAGRALALDPVSAGAAEIVAALMLEPPAEQPPELVAALKTTDAHGVRKHARTAVIAYLTLASFFPISVWNGVIKWPVVIAVLVLSLAMAAAAWRIIKHPNRTFVEMVAYAIGNAVMLALMSRMVGPFTFVPALTCVVMMSVMAYPAFIERSWVLIVIIVSGFLAPIALEAAGLLDTTWEMKDGGLLSHAGALAVNGRPTVTLVVLASLATIIIAGVHASRIARTNREAQHLLMTQAWHLRQLLPANPA